MTSANRGDSAPIARPVDRPFSESQLSPPKPALCQPSLTHCIEMDERQGAAALPSCLRSREVARAAGQMGQATTANSPAMDPSFETQFTAGAPVEGARTSRFIEQTRSPLPPVAPTPNACVEVKGGDR
jgi:hypothetical protein